MKVELGGSFEELERALETEFDVALQRACLKGSISAVKFLLKHGLTRMNALEMLQDLQRCEKSVERVARRKGFQINND